MENNSKFNRFLNERTGHDIHVSLHDPPHPVHLANPGPEPILGQAAALESGIEMH